MYSRIFIVKGNFSYCEISKFTKTNNTFVSPVYGSTLLDAYLLDSKGYSTLGVFTTKSIADQFMLSKYATFSEEQNVAFLDLPSYLPADDINYFLKISHEILTGPDKYLEPARQHLIDFNNALKKKNRKFTISDHEIEEIIEEMKDKKIEEKNALSIILSNFQSILNGNEVEIYSNR